jgi:acetyltransferase-like isoleucine patch superfamily enzyme
MAQPSPPTTTQRGPVTVSSTAYIADGARIQGNNTITIASHTLIHPRAHVNSTNCPINIGSHCMISEKAVIGGPILVGGTGVAELAVPRPEIQLLSSSSTATAGVVSSNSQPDPDSNPASPTPDPNTPKQTSPSTPKILDAKHITIANHVQISPHTHIQHSTIIHTAVLLEPHVTILPNCIIGAHTKICAGVTIGPNTVIPEWSVILGDGSIRRTRRQSAPAPTSDGSVSGGGSDGGSESPETNNMPERSRLLSQQKEREAAMLILRAGARPTMSSSQSQKRQSVVAPTPSNRGSIARGDGEPQAR